MSSQTAIASSHVKSPKAGYEQVIDEICNLNWTNLNDEDIIGLPTCSRPTLRACGLSMAWPRALRLTLRARRERQRCDGRCRLCNSALGVRHTAQRPAEPAGCSPGRPPACSAAPRSFSRLMQASIPILLNAGRTWLAYSRVT